MGQMSSKFRFSNSSLYKRLEVAGLNLSLRLQASAGTHGRFLIFLKRIPSCHAEYDPDTAPSLPVHTDTARV